MHPRRRHRRDRPRSCRARLSVARHAGSAFDRLCRWDAESEDTEEDDAAEEDDPAEASTGIDEAELDRSDDEPGGGWIAPLVLRDPAGKRGRWLMVRR